MRWWLRLTAHLGRCTCQTPGCLSCSKLGRAQNTGPAMSVPLWSTWEAEPEQLRPGKCMKCRAWFGQHPCRAGFSNLELEQCRPGKYTLPWTGANPVWSIYTASILCTHQWYVFAVLLPPHNRTEQVSLNKWPPLPSCVRVEIRHWRDLQTEESKVNRGNCLGSDRCNRFKPCT